MFKDSYWTTAGLPAAKVVRASKLQRLAALAVMFAFIVLAVANSMAKRPGCDEAWFASPAWNLASHGFMGTTILEPANSWVNGRSYHGIDRHTFWIMPLGPVVQAAWYRIVPFSLLSTRLLSALWGLVAIGAWFCIMLKTSGDERVALAAAALVASDYVLVRSASFGRMDMMCAALVFGAYAVYLCLREQHLSAAVLAGHTLSACALFTHPNGMLSVVLLVLAFVLFDFRNLRKSHVALALLPYCLAALAWGFYISQAPSDFWAQLSGNAAGRLSGLGSPLQSLYSEFQNRYAGGGAPVKLLLFLPLLVGLAGVLAAPALRRQRGYQLLLLLSAFEFIYFWLFESTKLYLYLVYLTPVLDSLLAVSLLYFWPTRKIAVIAVVMSVACINLGGSAFVVRRNNIQDGYRPAADYLKAHTARGELIMGTASLAFELGWDRGLLDDIKLGDASGRHPTWVVVEQRYRDEFDSYRRSEPAAYEHIVNLVRNGCTAAFSQSTYSVYRCGAAEMSNRGQ